MTPNDSMLGSRLDRLQRLALTAAVAGLALCIAGAFIDRGQFFRSYLWAFIYWTGMAIGSLGLLLLSHVVGGRWGVVIRRLLEAGARTLPLMLILVVPVLFGMSSLYLWTWPDVRAHDANIQAKAAYLNEPFFIGRVLFYFAVFMVLAWLVIRRSLEQDRTANLALVVKLRQISAPALLVFTLTASFAFIDLIMSLEPHWFSTIYGAMFLIGEMLAVMAFVIVLLTRLSSVPPFRDVLTVQHFHDLGNLMFAFTVLWAYLSFSQFLIIWAGNLPEEIPWYLRRFAGGWGVVAVGIAVFHFAVPFALLLYRFVKRNSWLLEKVALWMIVIRMVDVFWVIAPAFTQEGMPHYGHGFTISWMDPAALIGIGGLWIAAFVWNLKRYPLVPVNDPRLLEVPRQMVEGVH